MQTISSLCKRGQAKAIEMSAIKAPHIKFLQ